MNPKEVKSVGLRIIHSEDLSIDSRSSVVEQQMGKKMGNDMESPNMLGFVGLIPKNQTSMHYSITFPKL